MSRSIQPVENVTRADARNRESDAFDDYLDARHEARSSGSGFFAYVADILFRRWSAMRRRDER